MLEKEKAPLTSALHAYLKSQVEKGLMAIDDLWLAVSQLIGMIKQENFLAVICGFVQPEPEAQRLLAINIAVDMFIQFYATQEYLNQYPGLPS